MWLQHNWFKLAIVLIFLIAIFLTAYYFFVFNPHPNTQLSLNPTINSTLQEASSTKISTTTSVTVSAKQYIAQTLTPSQINSTNSDILSSTLLKQIMAHIVLVKCYGAGEAVQGSGTAGLINQNDPVVVTNFHVLSAAGGVGAVCSISIPNPPDYSPGDLFATQIGLFDTHYPYVDAALLHPENISSSDLPLFQKFPLSFCDESKVQIGDKVTLFGYPAIGQTSITVTDGIISGFIQNQYGNIYKTSALLDHGISGGLAVLNENSCVLGIPTWEVSDLQSGANLGYIQSWDSIKNSGDIFQTNTSNTVTTQTPTQPQQTTPTVTQPSTPAPTTPQDDEIAAENYYQANHTCVGLSGNQYNDCLTYGYNH